jgi:hypothetical protein
VFRPPADVRIVRSLEDTDTTTSRNWAPTDRPVRPPAVVYIEMEVRHCAGERRRQGEVVTADLISRARTGDRDAFREVTEPYRRELKVHCLPDARIPPRCRGHPAGDSTVESVNGALKRARASP